MADVVHIGVDPHKLSATIEVLDERETVLATGRFGTDRGGYAAMRRQVAAWPARVWAVEGSNGAGRPLAQRLLADGEQVLDVPAKLSARARLFDTGHNRKTDAHDAHAVAVVAVRIAVATGSSRLDRSARTQDRTLTSYSSERAGYRYKQPMTSPSVESSTVKVKPSRASKSAGWRRKSASLASSDIPSSGGQSPSR